MTPKNLTSSTDLRRATTLVTGFPGFVASNLVAELIAGNSDASLVLLVQHRMMDAARTRVEALKRRFPQFDGSLELVEGDVTQPRLGLTVEVHERLLAQTGVVWHLAAIYDLAAPEQVSFQVNVGGTHRVLDFCAACHDFLRLNYVSTLYVSGERKGTIFEDELDENQSHPNHYESTKFWAELEVRKRMDSIDTVIYRPAITVGDSQTGATDKFDGPYFVFRALRKLPAWMPIPNPAGAVTPNIIPIDFLRRALVFLGERPESSGQTFHIADPHPMRASEIFALALKLLERGEPKGSLPASLLGQALRSEALEDALGLPREVVRYFTHDARYDTTNTDDALAETDFHCPHLSSYMLTLLDYMDRHLDETVEDDLRGAQ